MKRTFWIVIIICIAVTIFAIQNSTYVSIKYLFWQGYHSLALMLLLTFVIGAITGSLVSFLSQSRKSKDLNATNNKVSSPTENKNE